MVPLDALAALCRDHVPTAIAVFDRAMTYVFANRAWSEQHELGDRELLGRNHYEICPGTSEARRAMHRRGLAGEHARCDRDRFVRSDGTTMWVDWEVVPWRAADGSLGGIAILGRGVTERVQLADARAEVHRLLSERERLVEHERAFGLRIDALRRSALAISMLESHAPARSSELLQLILDQARILAAADYGALGVGTDPDRPFAPWLWSGVTREQAQAIGAPPRPVGLLGQIARDGTKLRLETTLGAPGAVGLPPNHIALGPLLGVPIRHRERSVGNIYLARRPGSTPFSIDDLSLLELLADHAAVAIDNAALYEQVRAEVRAREEVLAVVSHDLKSPLNAIALREQLLARQHGSAVDTHTSAVVRSVTEMRRMVLGLLDVASLDVGNLRLHRTAVDVGRLVAEVAESARPIADDRQLSFEVRADGVGEVSLDRERMWQVMSNLVGNAIKFTPEGGRIELRATRGPSELAIAVSDTGPGIAAEVLPHVFDRYFTTALGAHGTGLGLYIVKGLVEAHGGHVTVESTAGHGTTFVIALPLAPA